MPRIPFSLKTLLWLMAVVAAFCGGMAVQRAMTPEPYKPFFADKVIGYSGPTPTLSGAKSLPASQAARSFLPEK